MGLGSDVGVVAGAIGIIMAVFVGLVGLAFIGMFIAVGIWYTNDDWLAAYTGVPEIGEVPFWRAVLTYWMAVLIFKSSNVAGAFNNKSKS